MDNNEDELDEFPLSASLISCMIKLTREEGIAIKSLINENYAHTYPFYARKVGISTPNFYSTLNGERPCSLEFLNKLLSGIGYAAIITDPEIVIKEIPQIEIIAPTEHLMEDDYGTRSLEMEKSIEDQDETSEEEFT